MKPRTNFDIYLKGKRGPVISPKGKTRITIFIDTDILDWFRDEAEREGRGYQTEINQALRNYIKQDKRPIQEIAREVVRKVRRGVKSLFFTNGRFLETQLRLPTEDQG